LQEISKNLLKCEAVLSKFHINPTTGNPGRCFALKKCRFGDDDEHYASKELAALAYENLHTSKEIPVLRKSDSEPKKLENFAVNLSEPAGELMTDDRIAEADQKFQNLKENSAKMMDDFKTPVEIKTPIDFSDDLIFTSVRYEDGHAVVTVVGSTEANFDGDYPVGDLTQDTDTVVRLLEADPELMFINGDCATLAWDLYDAYPEQVRCVSEIWVKGDVGSMHVIAELKDGSFIDGLGHWTPSGILSAWKNLMGKDVEIRLGEVEENHKKKAPMFESSKVLGEYLDRVK
jgi:hypothetical protein